jgi:transcriptional regulator with PAS, ATPase and Fis domain
MTLFCNGSVILPEHVVFPPDLESEQSSRESEPSNAGAFSNNSNSNSNNKEPGTDLSLASAVRRHVRFVYEQANRNQRRAAKLLDISRATLARHLGKVAQN